MLCCTTRRPEHTVSVLLRRHSNSKISFWGVPACLVLLFRVSSCQPKYLLGRGSFRHCWWRLCHDDVDLGHCE